VTFWIRQGLAKHSGPRRHATAEKAGDAVREDPGANTIQVRPPPGCVVNPLAGRDHADSAQARGQCCNRERHHQRRFKSVGKKPRVRQREPGLRANDGDVFTRHHSHRDRDCHPKRETDQAAEQPQKALAPHDESYHHRKRQAGARNVGWKLRIMRVSNSQKSAHADEAQLHAHCNHNEARNNPEETSCGHCRFICEWFCTFRCIRVCLLLCRRFPLERIESPLSEAFEFAQASARLAAEAAVLERLTNAVEASNAEAFQAIVDESRLGRFCIQLCHWICFFHCRRFCVCPPRSAAYFIKVGQYEYSEVYPIGGTTPKIESQIGGSGLTSDTRAFFGTLRLNGGFSLQTGAPQVEYRFETIPTNAAGNPTAPNWQPVLADGEQTIIGYTITTGPVFTPVVASLDADGWIQVPLAGPSYVPTGDLLHLGSLKLSNPPHLDQTGVVAGAHSSHPLAQDVYFGIRMRVRNVGNPGSELDAGTCHHIAIDNTLYDKVTHQPA
jgi:hypothetical protein